MTISRNGPYMAGTAVATRQRRNQRQARDRHALGESVGHGASLAAWTLIMGWRGAGQGACSPVVGQFEGRLGYIKAEPKITPAEEPTTTCSRIAPL